MPLRLTPCASLRLKTARLTPYAGFLFHCYHSPMFGPLKRVRLR